MKSFSSWMVETIRQDHQIAWMEEKRFELVAQFALSIKNIIDGKATILITDKKREWFYSYALNRLNPSSFDRPLLPIVGIDSLYAHVDSVDDEDKILLLDDMLLSIFEDGFNYFYIGQADDKRAEIAKSKRDSMLWLFDKKESNSIYLNSFDKRSDIKLIELLDIYESAIEATLFGEIDLEGAL